MRDPLFETNVRGQICSRVGCHMNAQMYGICEEHLKERGQKKKKRNDDDESYVDRGDDNGVDGAREADLEPR